jgi:regulator of extracellular matrix RemA (YlzA/DUF370 family)
MRFVNIGFGNTVCAERIVSVVSPESAPIKRLVIDGKASGNVIDVSCGRKTRSVLITDCGNIILSSLQCETVSSRLSGGDDSENRD